jgi:threonine/homoserine/homoserine lactone efflux protein
MMELMIILSGIFVTSFIVALSGALMPGPLLAVTIKETPVRGFWAGPLIVAGHGILELLLVVLLLFGLGTYLKREIVFALIGMSGALVLIWMAIGMYRSLPTLQLVTDSSEKSGMNPVWSGIIMSLANPYWFVWWATIGLGYITYSMKYSATGIAAFFSGHIMADLIWYSFVSFGISRGRRFISDGVYRGIIAACASVLVVFSIWFGITGVQKFIASLNTL